MCRVYKEYTFAICIENYYSLLSLFLLYLLCFFLSRLLCVCLFSIFCSFFLSSLFTILVGFISIPPPATSALIHKTSYPLVYIGTNTQSYFCKHVTHQNKGLMNDRATPVRRSVYNLEKSKWYVHEDIESNLSSYVWALSLILLFFLFLIFLQRGASVCLFLYLPFFLSTFLSSLFDRRTHVYHANNRSAKLPEQVVDGCPECCPW